MKPRSRRTLNIPADNGGCRPYRQSERKGTLRTAGFSLMTHCASNTSRSLSSSARLRILLGIVFTRDATENVLPEIFPVWSPSPSLKALRQYRSLRRGSLVSGHWTSPGSGIDAIQGLPVRSNTIGPLRRWAHVLMSLSPVGTPITGRSPLVQSCR